MGRRRRTSGVCFFVVMAGREGGVGLREPLGLGVGSGGLVEEGRGRAWKGGRWERDGWGVTGLVLCLLACLVVGV